MGNLESLFLVAALYIYIYIKKGNKTPRQRIPNVAKICDYDPLVFNI